jgi:BetR domain
MHNSVYSARMPAVAKSEVLDAEIGERLHWWMWRNRVNQLQLAQQTGMSAPSLGRKLRGATPWLASEVRDVARAIGKPISWLYGEEADADDVRPKGLEPPTFWSVLEVAA